MIKHVTCKNALILWGLFSLLLLICLAVSINLHAAVKFFAVLNVLNILPAAIVLLFKNRVKELIGYLADDYEKSQHNTNALLVEATYRHEVVYGTALMLPVVLTGCYMITLAFTDAKLYRYTIQEDGLIEYSSVICWLLAIVFLSIDLIRKKLRNEKSRFIVNPSAVLLMFFAACAGEELSWGQRWFGVVTPEIISKVNVQNEINLHNIGSISVFSNLFFILTLIFFLIIPWLTKRNIQLKKYLCQYSFPIPNRFVTVIYITGLFIWIVIGVRFGTLGFHPFSFYPENYHTQMDDEIFKFLAAYSFMVFSIMSFLKNQTDRH